jgi:hypothetical protein
MKDTCTERTLALAGSARECGVKKAVNVLHSRPQFLLFTSFHSLTILAVLHRPTQRGYLVAQAV